MLKRNLELLPSASLLLLLQRLETEPGHRHVAHDTEEVRMAARLLLLLLLLLLMRMVTRAKQQLP